MLSDSEKVAIMTAKYKELISSFINGQISAQEFETFYLKLFQYDTNQVPGIEFNILEELFFDVDDYAADPELRERAGGLDDEELRTRAREAYRKLYETYGVSAEPPPLTP
jgi:Bacterial self-protective colicin-like immunity